MKIYNFNHPFQYQHSLYLKQYREYIQFIWHQVQSLYDFIINFNPPYEIINREGNPNHISNLLTDDIVNGWYGSEIDDDYIYNAYNLTFRQGFINTGVNAKLKWNANIGDNYIPFPSGYVCISNTNKAGNLRLQNDYSILPASVPALYWYSYSMQNLVAQYYENRVGNRVDSIIFTLPKYNCRFITSHTWGGNAAAGFSLNSNSIKTKENMIWTGEPLQLHHYYSDTYEEIFADITYDTHIIHSVIDNIKTLQQEITTSRTNELTTNLITTYII